MELSRSTPSDSGERITIIDIIRGIALWGVLASNMIGFSSPEVHFVPSIIWMEAYNHFTGFLLDILVSEKFITIFAVLFGVGFAIQMDKMPMQGWRGIAIYLRRLSVLFLLGLLNGIFFWYNDILVTYAVFGAILLLFRNQSQKTLLWWIFSLQGFMLLISVLFMFEGKKLPSMSELQQLINLYSQGNWTDIQEYRYSEFIQEHSPGSTLLVMLPFVFSRFLFGLWLWRSRFLYSLGTKKKFIRNVCVWSIIIGITGETITEVFRMGEMGPLRIFSVPMLAIGYSAGIALLFSSGSLSRLSNAFAAIGKNSLKQLSVSNHVLYNPFLFLWRWIIRKSRTITGINLEFFNLYNRSSAEFLVDKEL